MNWLINYLQPKLAIEQDHMIPNSSLEKTCASKNHNNSIWFNDLIDLIDLFGRSWFLQIQWSPGDLIHVTQEGWKSQGTKNYTKHDICMIGWIDQLFLWFLWFLWFLMGLNWQFMYTKLDLLRFIISV